MNKTLTIILSMMCLSLYGQDRPSNSRSISQSIACTNPNAGFTIDGKFYKGSLPSFICESLLPLDIVFTDSIGTPINDPTLTWFGNITHSSTDPIFKSKLLKSNFIGTLASFGVKYGVDSISIKISKDVDYRPKPGLIEHGYDDNKITQYWPSATNPPNTPWLFARPSTSPTAHLAATNLVGDTIAVPKSLFNHIRVASSSTSLSLDHNRFTKRFDDFIVSNNGVPGDSMHLTGCTTRKNLYLFTKAPNVITVPIKFIRIGETDDDEINYCKTDSTMQKGCMTKINSATHKCILEGADGTYEEGAKAKAWVDSLFLSKFWPSWVSKNDSIAKVLVSGKNVYHIIAGNDKVCNTKPIPKDTFFDPLQTASYIMTQVKHANKIYNEYGVNITFDSLIFNVYYLNYDTWKSNDSLEIKENIEMITKFSPLLNSNYILTSVTKDLERANAWAFLNNNFIQISSGKPNSRTFAHEIGHAMWGLDHCDNTQTYLNEDGITTIPVINPKVIDKNNFMFSLYDSKFKPIIRHYQWKKIFLKTYK